MNPTVKRLTALAAVGAAMGIVGPVASANAAGPPVAPAQLALPLGQFPLPQFPAFTPGSLSFAGPSVGQLAAVIGPTVITTAPSTFNNTNIQTSAGSNLTGGQAGP